MSFQDLQAELRDLQETRPDLKTPDLFVMWFVMARLGESDPQVAAAALTGGAGDKGVDAVYVDHDSETVSIVQGKFSSSPKGTEPRSDVLAFASLSATLFDDERYRAWDEKAMPTAAARLREARKLLLKRAYRLNLYFVTTRGCSDTLEREGQKSAQRSGVEFAVFQRRDIERLMRDYLDGVAPPIPRVQLPIETAPASGYIKRHDPKTKITSWIVSIRGGEVAMLYEKYGEKIFARNIRGYLGSSGTTSVNYAIAQTLKSDPAHFWYFNNGVTIACDDAQKIERGGKDVLQVDNPQIVNGQQTTRTLAEGGDSDKASVLVRVISLPGGDLRLVENIVKATNNQNPIRPSDLMANDRIQVYLERKLRLRGYQYLRKRGKKSDAKAASKVRPRFQIMKEELAQSIAACEEDPTVVYSAKENLFDVVMYDRLFRKEDLAFYLTRYWLVRTAGRSAKREGVEIARMKFFVAHAVWDRKGNLLTKYADPFVRAAENSFGGADTSALHALEGSVDKTLTAVARFYKRTKSKEDSPYSFWKRVRQYEVYLDFMADAKQSNLRSQIDKADDTLSRAF